MSKDFAEVFGTLQTTTAPNSVVGLDVSGLGGFGIQITGTFTGTVNFEGSVDGTTFLALNVVATNGSSSVTSATAVGAWQGSCVGLKLVRCRMSGSPTGAAVVTLYAELASPGGAGGGGGGGGGDATAANQVLQIADLDALAAQTTDYDTGGGTDAQVMFGIALPASGGAVGVSTSNPLPITIVGDSVGATADTEDGTIAGGQSNVALVAGLTMMWDGSNWKRASSATPVPTSNAKLSDAIAGEYETVAASQTGQALGASGATGDYIAGVLVIPATTSPGNVLLLDNATSITVFTGGATSVSNLVPFFIPLGIYSVSGAWKLTTGANVSCIGIGNFT